MITVLSHFFIKDRDRMEDGSVRRAYGMLCSIVGILLNVLLFAGKISGGRFKRLHRHYGGCV